MKRAKKRLLELLCPPPAPVRVGEAVRELRFIRQLNQCELAVRMGVNRPFITKVERDYQGVSVPTLFRLAAALDVDAHILLDANARHLLIERAVLADSFITLLLPHLRAISDEQRILFLNQVSVLALSRGASSRRYAYKPLERAS